LPIANKAPHNFFDSLFTSTASVCVAGLSTVVPKFQFTLFGKLVMLVLMQIGALGFIFVVSTAILIIKRKLTFKDSINIGTALGTPEDLKNIRPLIRRIVVFTFISELVGAIILGFRFVPMFGVSEGILQSVFTSISSYCNCGYDILGSNSLVEFANNHDYLVLGVCAVLTLFGSLGFIVWNELYEKLKMKVQNRLSFSKVIHSLSVHTKLVLVMNLVMIVFGTAIFLLIEKNNVGTIGNYNLLDKILISLFHGISARTTGMAGLNLAGMTNSGKFFTIILMMIGGAPRKHSRWS
jgi:trk system potassium uptake protein TrkH